MQPPRSTCNFHRDWKYLSILSGNIFGLCNIFRCFGLSWVCVGACTIQAPVLFRLHECYHHSRDSDGARTEIRHVVVKSRDTRARLCLNITKKMRASHETDAPSLSDALWYLGFSGTGTKVVSDQIVTSPKYNPLSLLQMVTTLLIYFFGIFSTRGEDKNSIRREGWGREHLEHLESRDLKLDLIDQDGLRHCFVLAFCCSPT